MTKVIDTNHDTTRKLGELKALGIETIIRYFNRHGPGNEKVVKPDEARAIAAAGMKLGIVYEYTDTLNQFTPDNGVADAQWTRAYASKVGMPANAGIYFAVDLDVSASQIRASIIPYFRAVSQQLPAYRIGVYGSGLTCQMLLDAYLIDLTWISCSTGWQGSKAFVAAGKHNLLQHLPKTIAGLDTDPNEINPAHSNIGDFVPFGGVVTPPPPSRHPGTLSELQAALGLPVGPLSSLDDFNKMVLAVRKLQRDKAILIDGIAGPQTLATINLGD